MSICLEKHNIWRNCILLLQEITTKESSCQVEIKWKQWAMIVDDDLWDGWDGRLFQKDEDSSGLDV